MTWFSGYGTIASPRPVSDNCMVNLKMLLSIKPSLSPPATFRAPLIMWSFGIILCFLHCYHEKVLFQASCIIDQSKRDMHLVLDEPTHCKSVSITSPCSVWTGFPWKPRSQCFYSDSPQLGSTYSQIIYCLDRRMPIVAFQAYPFLTVPNWKSNRRTILISYFTMRPPGVQYRQASNLLPIPQAHPREP